MPLFELTVLFAKDVIEIFIIRTALDLSLRTLLNIDLFGPQFVYFNIHGLCHLAEGVRKHGSLEETSAFPFENKILIIKNSVHQGGKDLEQAVRRSDEKDAINLLNSFQTPNFRLGVFRLNYKSP
jgi:hypothetical protein